MWTECVITPLELIRNIKDFCDDKTYIVSAFLLRAERNFAITINKLLLIVLFSSMCEAVVDQMSYMLIRGSTRRCLTSI